jgi:uncharacterized membrane protein
LQSQTTCREDSDVLLLALIAACAFIVAIVALTRANNLGAAAAEHHQALRSLERHIHALEDEVRRLRGAAGQAQEPAPTPAEPVGARATFDQRAPADAPAPPQRGEPLVREPIAPPVLRAGPPAPPAAARPPAPPAAPAPPALPALPAPAFDWENLVGVKLFSWIAAIALALGAVFFLRYSIQAGWLQPPVRMAIGILVGLGLLAGCEMKVARNYPVTANALDASGIVILFSTFFAAFALWHLIGAGPAFLFLMLVTAVAVLLSIRRDSLFIAVLGLIGGFLTPAVLSTGQDNPIGLFGYLLVLNAGLAWVAYHKRWALLTSVSLALTTLYQWSWVATFLTESKLPLAGAIFLVFPIFNSVALALARAGSDDARDRTFAFTAGASALLPLLFAAYLASVPRYGAHAGLLFGFLFCLDAGLFAVAVATGLGVPSAAAALGAPLKAGGPTARAGGPTARAGSPTARLLPAGGELLHLAGAFATNVIFLCFLAASYRSSAWPDVLGFVALFVLFYLASPLLARRLGRPFTTAGRSTAYAGSTLLFAFPVLIALEPATSSPGLVFAVLFVLAGAASAYALLEAAPGLKPGSPTGQPLWDRRSSAGPPARQPRWGPRDRWQGGVHFIAAFFALVAEAVWSGRFLTSERLLPALAIYLVFALFYIGVPVLARRLDRPLRPPGAGGAILLASLALLFFPAGFLASDSALWGLALLVAILNVAVFVEGVSIRRPVLSLVSSVMSWWIICTWWARAGAASLTGPGLLVVAGFTMLTLGGHIWNAKRSDKDNAVAQNGVYLGLVGHLFLMFVAGQPALSIPPWPMLGTLLVVDLAVGASTLYVRQANLHLAAIVASALVLVAWLSHATAAPWPAIAIVSAAVLAWLAGAWMWLGRRTAAAADFVTRLDAGAALALLAALVVAMFASGQSGAPGAGFLTLAHVVFLAGLFAVAALRRWHLLAVVATGPIALTLAVWQATHADPAFWLPLLLLAGGIYAVFLAYPLLLGRRAGSAVEPYVAAVLASAIFFFAARHSLTTGGFGGVIGILPVCQALLMALLLVNLLRLEAPGSRQTGRLALVAGAALAFITIAIPLQLDKEWITIGWALEGAALAWLYRRLPHRGLLLASTGLLAAVFVRLALNPAVLVYQPRGAYRIWNWYLYTYFVCAAGLLAAGRLFQGTDDALVRGAPRLPRARSLVGSGGTVLLFLLLNIEIADFYSTGPGITFNLDATLAQDMTYTLAWGVFAVALLVAGIVIHSRPARFAALALLVVTVLKGFLHDLARLGGLYRVASFVGLAICLALVAVVLQRFVLRPHPGDVDEPAS